MLEKSVKTQVGVRLHLVIQLMVLGLTNTKLYDMIFSLVAFLIVEQIFMKSHLEKKGKNSQVGHI